MRILWLILMAVALGSPGAAVAQTPNRAGLLVIHGDGRTIEQCVNFEQEEISGVELLQNSGLDLGVKAQSMGAAICRLDGEGCSQLDSCFCQCQGSSCIYWSYWRLVDGVWQYSNQGASNTTVSDGAMEAWVWAKGIIGQEAEIAPPVTSFGDICAAAATPTLEPTATDTAIPSATPSATPTDTVVPEQPTATETALPTASHTPTRTPAPATSTPTFVPSTTFSPRPGPVGTFSPTPVSLPTIRAFGADRTVIAFGESVMLFWDVADTAEVWLRSPGGEEMIPAQGNRPITPEQSQTYTLIARSGAGEVLAETTVTVNPVFSAPTEMPTESPTDTPSPLPTATPIATEIPLPTDTPLLVDTPVPPATLPQEAIAETIALVPTTTSPDVSVEAKAEVADNTAPVPGGDEGQAGQETDQATLQSAPVAQPLPAPVNPPANPPVNPDVAQVQRSYQRLLLLGGIAFVLGTPLLFGAIWFIVWSMWRQRE